MSSSIKDIAYTLIYLEPRLVSSNPVSFEQEIGEHHFTAKDDGDALRQAARFLKQHIVSCNHVAQGREGKKLVRDFPLQIIKDHFPKVPAGRLRVGLSQIPPLDGCG